jgi:hypothetical protein
MSDLISRKAAIEKIESHTRVGDELYPLTDTDKILNHAFEIAASCVYNLPSAQPKQSEQRWIPCSEKEAEYPCLACDVFGQIFITNNGIVRINGECYDGTGFDFSNAEEFLKGIKVGNSMRMLPRKIVAWSPLPEPYKGGEHETD